MSAGSAGCGIISRAWTPDFDTNCKIQEKKLVAGEIIRVTVKKKIKNRLLAENF